MGTEFIVLAYVGPETVLPVTSVLAAIGGALLMGGRYLRATLVRCLRAVFRRNGETASGPSA